MDRKTAVSQQFGMVTTRRASARRQESKLEGKVCPSCGRILTTAERLAAETMLSAVCTECSERELTDLEAQVRTLIAAGRQARWSKMVDRALARVTLKAAAGR